MLHPDSAAPLLSIVVPTRNRQNCALVLAQALTASDSQAFELVIHDNSDDNSLGDAVADLADPRIRYIYSSAKMNMHENFSAVIAQSRGIFLCGLGDDDGILVETALASLDKALEMDADAVLTPKYSYSWPGVRHWLWGETGGEVIASEPRYPTLRSLDPLRQVEAVFADGTITGLGLLPRLYHGYIRRDALERLHARTGSYFPGGSPDMANAIGLAYSVNKMLFDPVASIISGHSKKSGGGAGAAGQHHGRIEDQAQLPENILDHWPETVPKYWSSITIYAQSAIAAAIASTTEALPAFAFHRLYAACLAYDRKQYRRKVIEAMESNPERGFMLNLRILFSILGIIPNRTKMFIANFWNHVVRRRRRQMLNDMSEVMAYLANRSEAGT